jgi:hypothetical protein
MCLHLSEFWHTLIIYYEEVSAVKEMRRVLSALIAIIWSIILTGSNAVFAQNNSNQTSASMWSTNVTKATRVNSRNSTAYNAV